MKKLKLIPVLICFVLAGCAMFCEHEYVSQVAREATCTAQGEEIFTCGLCQDSYTQPIAIIEHAFGEGVETKAPTCTEEGICLYTCSACGAEESKAVEKAPHTLGKLSVIREANCKEEGLGSGTCTVCAQTVEQAIPVNGTHVFVNEVIQESTCTKQGSGTDVCTVCNLKRAVQYPLKEHNYTYQEIKKVSCTQDGVKKGTCKDCGYSKGEETVAALGHKWKGGTCSVGAKCTNCGAEGKTTAHKYTVVSTLSTPKNNYAGKQLRKCKTCGVEVTVYYTENYDYDLEAIRNELIYYAKSLGFRVTTTPIAKDPQKSYSQPIYLLETGTSQSGKGPEKLLKGGKSCINAVYEYYKDSPAGLDPYKVYVSVGYGSSGSLGCGFFGVDIMVSF